MKVMNEMGGLLAPVQLGYGVLIESAEGVQQGDPLGPLLFCLTIHQLCSRMKSELSLDDGTLGGKVEDVLHIWIWWSVRVLNWV